MQYRKGHIDSYNKFHRQNKGWYGCLIIHELILDGIGTTKIFIGEHEKSPRFHIIDPNTRKYITTISLLKPEYIGSKSLRLNDRQKEQLVEFFNENSSLEWFMHFCWRGNNNGCLDRNYEFPDYTLLK